MSRRDIYVMSKRRPMAATLVALAGALLYADVASDAIRRIAKGMATVAQVVKWNRLQEECVIQFPGQNGRQHEASPSPPSTQIRFVDGIGHCEERRLPPVYDHVTISNVSTVRTAAPTAAL